MIIKLKEFEQLKENLINDGTIQEVGFNQCIQGNKIFVQNGVFALSQKKIDALIRIAEMQKYYQCNPVIFIKDFFNIELLDAQAWIVQQAWICPNVLLVCSRGFGKSTLIDLIIMSKDMLFSNYWCYIASGTGSQAEETFMTLERIANDNIDSFMGSTGKVFKNEIEIKNAAGDGFSHSSNGFSYTTFNGSMTQTLNSNIDRKRGKRGSVVFDECGFLSEEMMNVYGAFAIVNKSFKSGTDGEGHSIDPIRLKTLPKEIPNQLFYISSASSVDTKFYEFFREFSKKMLIGDKRYFVAMITCDVPLHPTIHGKLMNPLYEKSVIDNELKTNPEKARREYYCQFTTDAGSNAIIKRSVITRNEETRKPLLYNDTGDKKFIIAYDPARSRDNSVISVGEVYDYKKIDGTYEKRMRIVNCINLIDIGKKIKSPMRTPEQIDYLKQVILDYNGDAEDYGNIIAIYIDAGSGGGGVNIADYLMPSWVDKKGNFHKGLIDKEYSAEYVKNFPDAVDKIKLMSPLAYKSEMYEAMIELMSQDKISFTAQYNNKDYLTIFDVDDKLFNDEKDKIIASLKQENLNKEDFENRLSEELNKIQSVNEKTIKLEWEEKLALVNIDAMKEEIVNMVRIKRQSGKDSFELTPEKQNHMHDDRSYTACMLSYGLMVERRKNIIKRINNKPKNLLEHFPIKQPKRFSLY